MIGKLARLLIARGAETMLSVVLVLLFFLIFLAILTWTFPEGTPLAGIIRGGPERGLRSAGDRDLALDMGDYGAREVVAELSAVENKVKHRLRGEIAWKDSHAGQLLHHRQGVQTFDDSRATISFDEGHVMHLDENSLVVVKNSGSSTEDRRVRRQLVVLGGRLEGRIAAAEGKEGAVEILAGDGESKIRPKAAGSGPAVFTAVVGDDEQTTLSIHEGEAAVVTGDRTTVVRANESVVVTRDRRVTGPAPLPSPPAPNTPEDGFARSFRSRPPAIRFSWGGSSGAERYRLTVARDSTFRDVVYEIDLEATELTHPGFPAGRYFWRVRGVRGEAVGSPGETRRLVLTMDREPPPLRAAFPSGVVTAPEYVMKGFTDPGTRVFIAGQPVAVDASGRFARTIPLERGANMIVVEAVDESGNTTYRSELIHARY